MVVKQFCRRHSRRMDPITKYTDDSVIDEAARCSNRPDRQRLEFQRTAAFYCVTPKCAIMLT